MDAKARRASGPPPDGRARSSRSRARAPLPIPPPLIAALAATALHAGVAAQAPAASIAERTAGMQSHEGFLTVHFDPATGALLLEIPEERLGRDFLYVTNLATGLGSARAFNLDRGASESQGVVRLERHGERVMLIRGNAEVTASGGDAALRRATESFPVSVLAALPVVAQEQGRVLVEATDFVLGDTWGVAGTLRSYDLGSIELDRERSYVSGDFTGSYPRNTEVRAVLTFAAEEPSGELRRHAPDGRSITVEQHHSFVSLPDEPLPSRPYDPRTANSSATLEDYGEGFDGDYRRRAVARWRLVPSDPEAYLRGELVEPVEPIVYYLDPALPEPYRSAYREGTLWWNQTLE